MVIQIDFCPTDCWLSYQLISNPLFQGQTKDRAQENDVKKEREDSATSPPRVRLLKVLIVNAPPAKNTLHHHASVPNPDHQDANDEVLHLGNDDPGRKIDLRVLEKRK